MSMRLFRPCQALLISERRKKRITKSNIFFSSSFPQLKGRPKEFGFGFYAFSSSSSSSSSCSVVLTSSWLDLQIAEMPTVKADMYRRNEANREGGKVNNTTVLYCCVRTVERTGGDGVLVQQLNSALHCSYICILQYQQLVEMAVAAAASSS